MFQMSMNVTFNNTTISRSDSTLTQAGAMNRRTAHAVLKTAFEAARLNGKLTTLSMRKSFAQRLYDQTADIFVVQEMLGHKSVATTKRYLDVNYVSVREVIEKMAFSAIERGIDTLSPQMLKTTSDEALFLEFSHARVRPVFASQRSLDALGSWRGTEANGSAAPIIRTGTERCGVLGFVRGYKQRRVIEGLVWRSRKTFWHIGLNCNNNLISSIWL